jgi:hypothetical protein
MILLLGGARYATAQGKLASPEERQLALTDWNGKLHVGTEFFLNRTETKETVEKHFEEMHENGITLANFCDLGRH